MRFSKTPKSLFTCLLMVISFPCCSIRNDSAEKKFRCTYKLIWLEEDKFFPSKSLSYKDFVTYSKTDFISVFQSRLLEKNGREASLASVASSSLHEYYDLHGANASRELLKQCVTNYGGIYSVNMFFIYGLAPCISEEEWIQWSTKSPHPPSKLFSWRYLE